MKTTKGYIITAIKGIGLSITVAVLSLGAVVRSAEMDLGELVRQADVVFIGVVMPKPASDRKPMSRQSERQFQVVDRLKGEIGPEVGVEVVSALVEDGMQWARFETGERYLVFAKRIGDRYHLIGGREGRYRVEEQTTDGRVLLWRVVGGDERQVEVEEVYLDEVRAEVSRILQEEGQL